jgi:AFG3 family protein
VSYLTFNIGSVDSFERNLEQAQRELGIDPANHIPVTYSSEPAWFQNLVLNMLPTLLLIGAFVFFGRRLSGGASGRGVSGSLLVSRPFPVVIFQFYTHKYY